MGLFRFIFSKNFVINLALAGVASGIGAVVIFFCLDAYTEHGVTVVVPDFRGLKLNELEGFADTLEVVFEVNDSLYSTEFPRGTIAYQDPKPGATVKRGRKVYLTANAMLPKQLVLPDVRNLSLRQAKAVLESVGCSVGNLEYAPDIAENAVLEQKINGRSVRKGQLVYYGTVVDLVLGLGLSNKKIPVPYLIYYRLNDAIDRLHAMSLNLGTFKVDTPFTDTSLVRVYRQIPEYREKDMMPMGSSIILYLTQDTASIKYDTTLYNRIQLPLDSLYFPDRNEDESEEGND